MEEISNFSYIWSEWIVPLIDDLYSQLDVKFKDYCNVRIRDLDVIYRNAEKFYQNKREEAKRNFYGEYRKGTSETEHRMDFHKISAVLCRTLIEYKCFDYDENLCKEYVDKFIDPYNTDWVVRNALINFRLAFYGSVVFLYHSMQFMYNEENKELYDALKDKDKLDLYTSEVQHIGKVNESFENCVILDLAKRDVGNRSFDYFMYAIIMYQLEEHNKALLMKDK